MAERQPPNTQTLRPQHLTQVGHEGNPVECFVDVVGTLDSPNPFCTVDDDPTRCIDLGGPVIYPGGGIGSGGGGGGSEAPSIPLNAAGGTMNCFSGDTSVPLVATGGVPPYTWSTDRGVITVGDPTSSATLTPATNTGSSVAGTAYGKQVKVCCTFTSCVGSLWNCAGQITTTCSSVGVPDCGLGNCACSVCSGCSHLSGCVTQPDCACRNDPALNCCGNGTTFASSCAALNAVGTACDLRSAQMIADGCNPCAVQFMSGEPVVTVTDSEGNQFSFTVTVETSE